MQIEEQLEILHRLYKEQDDIYRTYATKKGITVTEFWILYTLCNSEATYSQQELSTIWFYPKQTVNSAINKLIREGKVLLRPTSNAHNRKIIELTEKGKEFCQCNIKPLITAEEVSFVQFSEKERIEFLKLFQKQISNLKSELKRS